VCGAGLRTNCADGDAKRRCSTASVEGREGGLFGEGFEGEGVVPRLGVRMVVDGPWRVVVVLLWCPVPFQSGLDVVVRAKGTRSSQGPTSLVD
jgi:hypothetical protein